MVRNFFKKNNKAFSLIEMSIVLIIIAIILLAVIISSSAINNSYVNSVTTDLTSFTKKIYEFKQKYNKLPGDFNEPEILGLSTENSGNANGIIDVSEELLFWKHLYHAGFLNSEMDGQTLYPNIGIPASLIDHSGYRVISSDKQEIAIELSGYSDVSIDLPILTPDQAYKIDLEIDDGNPNTGKIRAQGDNCIQGQKYGISDNKECRIIYYLLSNEAVVAQAQDCQGADLGSRRTLACPDGFKGNIYEICVNGDYEEIYNDCSSISCAKGFEYGDQRLLSCPDGYSGQITQTCSEYGIFQITDECVPNLGLCVSGSYELPCPFGKIGKIDVECVNAFLVATDNCQPINCGAHQFLQTRTIDCPNNYSGYIVEKCAINGEYIPIVNHCVPDYGICSGSQRDIGCAFGQGEYIQECKGVWQDKSNNCREYNCGYEIAQELVSSVDKCDKGAVYQVCDKGNRVETRNNCVE